MSTESKKRLDLDKKLEEVSGWKKARYILGGLCFIAGGTFVLIHLGFVDTSTNHSYNYSPKPFLSRQNIWLLNLGMGVFGGALLGYPRIIVGALSGLVSAAAITGATLLYLSWRESVFMAEIVLPMLTGLIGFVIYNSLNKNREQ